MSKSQKYINETINKPAEPRLSASIILLRERDGIEVLMIKRNANAFFGNALVFPGGVVDEFDNDISWSQYLDAPSSFEDDEIAIKIAAWREAYEETGFLPNGKNIGIVLGTNFQEILRQNNCKISPENMVKLSNWCSPDDLIKRFDAHFYIAAIDGETPAFDGNEAVAAFWAKPQDIIEMAKNQNEVLIFATKCNLMQLAKCGNINEVVQMANAQPKIKIQPENYMKDGRRFVRISPDAGFDIWDDELHHQFY